MYSESPFNRSRIESPDGSAKDSANLVEREDVRRTPAVSPFPVPTALLVTFPFFDVAARRLRGGSSSSSSSSSNDSSVSGFALFFSLSAATTGPLDRPRCVISGYLTPRFQRAIVLYKCKCGGTQWRKYQSGSLIQCFLKSCRYLHREPCTLSRVRKVGPKIHLVDCHKRCSRSCYVRHPINSNNADKFDLRFKKTMQ
jgi:hypothetical protein